MSAPPVLDIEASGFGRGSYPIEIGFAGPGDEVFCSLILPEPDWLHWDTSAQSLHGISRELLLAHGKPAAWLCREINARLAGLTVYCDGWGNDYAWLARLFDAGESAPRFKLEDLRRLLSEDEAARWGPLTQAVRARCTFERHRASNDARVLRMALQQLKHDHGAHTAR